MKISLLFHIVFFSILTMSCGRSDNNLTPEERIVVDSLYNLMTSKEKLKQDSICKINRDTTFKHAVDSIKKVRIGEIEQLISH
jgi:hypothetical protein